MGGKPKAPKPPPASPAPVRADSAVGEQAYITSSRRQGLASTRNPANPLAPSSALGAMGKLGAGGEGTMINDIKADTSKPKLTRIAAALKPKLTGIATALGGMK